MKNREWQFKMEGFTLRSVINALIELNEQGCICITEKNYGIGYDELIDEVVQILNNLKEEFDLKPTTDGIKITLTDR